MPPVPSVVPEVGTRGDGYGVGHQLAKRGANGDERPRTCAQSVLRGGEDGERRAAVAGREHVRPGAMEDPRRGGRGHLHGDPRHDGHQRRVPHLARRVRRSASMASACSSRRRSDRSWVACSSTPATGAGSSFSTSPSGCSVRSGPRTCSPAATRIASRPSIRGASRGASSPRSWAIAGQLYDRIGPRALVTVGFAVLAINTWHLSQLDATTALGSVDRERVARGASLVNGTRFVAQSIGVALLTTILAGSLSPATRALQRRTQSQATSKASTRSNSGASPSGATPSGVSAAAPVGGLCVAAGESRDLTPPIRGAGAVSNGPVLRRACNENLAGPERAYRFTFYASLVAFLLGLFLPGWPG